MEPRRKTVFMLFATPIGCKGARIEDREKGNPLRLERVAVFFILVFFGGIGNKKEEEF